MLCECFGGMLVNDKLYVLFRLTGIYKPHVSLEDRRVNVSFILFTHLVSLSVFQAVTTDGIDSAKDLLTATKHQVSLEESKYI